MPNVTNPMRANLDAAHFDILNVAALEASNALLGTPGSGSFGVLMLADDGADPSIRLAVIAGTRDPSTGFIGPVTPGSLYCRHVSASLGELWAKTGPGNGDWVKLA